jgi:hypothetical protein
MSTLSITPQQAVWEDVALSIQDKKNLTKENTENMRTGVY